MGWKLEGSLEMCIIFFYVINYFIIELKNSKDIMNCHSLYHVVKLISKKIEIY